MLLHSNQVYICTHRSQLLNPFLACKIFFQQDFTLGAWVLFIKLLLSERFDKEKRTYGLLVIVVHNKTIFCPNNISLDSLCQILKSLEFRSWDSSPSTEKLHSLHLEGCCILRNVRFTCKIILRVPIPQPKC